MHNVCWMKQLLLCSTHKDAGMTLSPKHLFTSDYKNLKVPFFPPLHHVLRQRDCTSLDLLPLPPPSEMGPECIRALRLSHCHAKTVAVITAEAIVSR